MKSKPFFSIIIPTLNEEAYLPILLQCLQKQTFTDFEIIVVDGNSHDKTQNIAQASKKTTLIVSNKRNVAYQRNLGGNKSKGQYLLFVDADTKIPPYFLEGIKYQLMVKKADLFTTWISQEGTHQADRFIVILMNLLLESNRLWNFYQVAYGAMIGCSRLVFKKSTGFNPTITFGEDSEFVTRLVKLGYNYVVFKDPRYIFSLRRFRKEGTLTLLRKYAKLDLQIMINGFPKNSQNDYPMLGGSYYHGKKRYPKLLISFEKTIQKIGRQGRQSIQKVIEGLLSD